MAMDEGATIGSWKESKEILDTPGKRQILVKYTPTFSGIGRIVYTSSKSGTGADD